MKVKIRIRHVRISIIPYLTIIAGGHGFRMMAIYARVSTEEQAKHGFSLADQLRECRKKVLTELAGTPVDNSGYRGLASGIAGQSAFVHEIVEYVDEGESGEFLDRPQLVRLREDLRRGLISHVVCLDPDRLSRKLMNQLILTDEIEARAKLLFVNGDYARTPEGQLFYQMRGAISQFEKAKINERMTRGRREKARQGKVLRDYHVFGYDFDPATGKFIINEREAHVVRLVFDLFLHPDNRVQGLSGIARHLNERGIRSKHGGQFHRQVIRQMLMNRAYIGEFYQNKWNTEGVLGNKYRDSEARIAQRLRPRSEWIYIPVPAIVTREEFDLTACLLEQSRRRFARQSRQKYLLGGLLRCRHCGNTLTGRTQKNWGKPVALYTDRKTGANVKNPGCGTTIPCAELDRRVWEALVSWVSLPLRTPSQSEPPSLPGVGLREEGEEAPFSREYELVTKELGRVNQGIERAIEFALTAGLEEGLLHNKVKQLQERRRVLLEDKERLETMRSIRRDTQGQDLNEAWKEFENSTYDQIPVELKKLLVRSVVKEIYVGQREGTVEIKIL